MPREVRIGAVRAGLLAVATVLSLVRATPVAAASLPEPPFDPSVMAEWTCHPAFERAGRKAAGPCGCAWPGACGDRAPAGCYCDARCGDEGDCCPDAGLCAEDPS